MLFNFVQHTQKIEIGILLLLFVNMDDLNADLE